MAGAAVLAADDVFVVSPSALYVLPDTVTAIRYPFLPGIEDAGGETRNAGYATTSAMDLSGRLVAFTWIERHEGRTLTYQIVANTWLGGTWDTPLDLAPGSPLLIDGSAEFLRLSAAVFAPDGTLWLGTSDAQVAAYKGGVWTHHFTSASSPLIAGEPIQALTAAADGTLWIAQASGMLTYGGSGLVETPTIYLPRAQKP